jgi:Icc protein
VSDLELTTVADDEAVFHRGDEVLRHDGLEPDTEYTLHGVTFRTLPRPPGQRLATFATVNDVHFGEVECGHVEGMDIGPVLHREPGEEPYPETMNRGAVAEMLALGPDAVVVKGDLTTHGTVEEFKAFLGVYEAAFGPKLHYVRGNHDAAHGEEFAADAPLRIDLPGVTLAVLDTVIPGLATGQVSAPQLAWLDDLAGSAERDRPVLVFGHHHPWMPGSNTREPGYFGINPDDSEKLVEVVARRPAISGYFAGHTHRNRVRRFAATGDVPWVEVACVKDFPGAWAEYRVFEGGVLQVHRRISSPDALAWTNATRAMFQGFYPQYAFGALADRCFGVIHRISTRTGRVENGDGRGMDAGWTLAEVGAGHFDLAQAPARVGRAGPAQRLP